MVCVGSSVAVSRLNVRGLGGVERRGRKTLYSFTSANPFRGAGKGENWDVLDQPKRAKVGDEAQYGFKAEGGLKGVRVGGVLVMSQSLGGQPGVNERLFRLGQIVEKGLSEVRLAEASADDKKGVDDADFEDGDSEFALDDQIVSHVLILVTQWLAGCQKG